MPEPDKYMADYYSKLIGYEVIGIAYDHDEFLDDDIFGLVIKHKRTKGVPNPKKKIAWIQRDPEGNGPGHLAVEDYEEE